MKSIVDLLPNHCAILYSQMIRIRMYSFSSKRLYHLGGAFEHCIECLINQFVDYINWCSFWFLFWLIKRDKINGMQRFLKNTASQKTYFCFHRFFAKPIFTGHFYLDERRLILKLKYVVDTQWNIFILWKKNTTINIFITKWCYLTFLFMKMY